MSKANHYDRILLKLSGEALTDGEFGLNGKILKELAKTIADVAKTGTQVAIVIGGGNIWRYRDNEHVPIERATSDTIGMLATVMNAIALQNAIEHAGAPSRVQSATTMPQIAEPYIRRKAIRHLEKGRVVIFAAGTGNPYFTTDTAAALRALEIEADVVLKGSKVDGVYDADPETNKDAKRYDSVSFDDVLQKRLNVMDSTAISLCRENELPIIVFNIFDNGSLAKVTNGEQIGTKVS